MEMNISQLKKNAISWKRREDIFRITEEKENNFDKDHSEYIDRKINVNIYRVKAFPTLNSN